jgi:hypothetical protein
MKKIALVSLVLLLLAVSVTPVMAAGGNNGHGNGNGNTNGNNGNHGGTSEQAHERQLERKQDRSSNPGSHGNGSDQYVRRPFYLQGTISAIDLAAKTVTVTLVHGNSKVKEYIGSDLLLQTTEGTLIFKITQGGDDDDDGDDTSSPTASNETDDEDTPGNRVPIPFDQLEVGQSVAIHGNLMDSVYTARLITVYIRALEGEPETSEP